MLVVTVHEIPGYRIEAVLGEVVGVKLQARGERLIYRVRILERSGHLITVGIDAVSRRIMAPGDT